MKPKILLRIASFLMLFHLIGHTFGQLGWRKADEPVKQEVIRQMTEYKFPFMGATRSMGDYFEGYGWATSIALIFFALVLWFTSGALNNNTAFIKELLVSLAICLFSWSILEFVYFFAFAGSITLLAAILTLIAYIQVRKSI